MSGFIEGDSRNQSTLLPDCLNDYITEENPVRVIDVFLDSLNLHNLGFKTIPAQTGRPAYHPSTMLKLYVYGYLNRIQSSRRLERESNRNIELMWLLKRLTPDFKTIADFRKDNTKPIQKVCREFVLICRKLNLFAEAFIAIDGSKFKAVNNRQKNYTAGKIKSRLKLIDESIAKYLKQIELTDSIGLENSTHKTEKLQQHIDRLTKEVEKLNTIQAQLKTLPGKQLSLTDPDSRSMSSGNGRGTVGYNVQTAVDTKYHLIVAHEVTNDVVDRSQLANMAKKSKQVLQVDNLTVIADRGYYKGEEIKACEDDNIITYLPKSQTSNNQAKGLFGRHHFIYHPDKDEYVCPTGQTAIYRCQKKDRNRMIRCYWSSACIECTIKNKCTQGKYRSITRWEHEEVLDELEARMDSNKEMMKIRKCTVEHPFGTIKSWMGATHFQMKTLQKVSTEMSLHVLAYNLKRVMNILGTKSFIEAIQA